MANSIFPQLTSSPTAFASSSQRRDDQPLSLPDRSHSTTSRLFHNFHREIREMFYFLVLRPHCGLADPGATSCPSRLPCHIDTHCALGQCASRTLDGIFIRDGVLSFSEPVPRYTQRVPKCYALLKTCYALTGQGVEY